VKRSGDYELKIGSRLLRDDRPAYIIAEGGVNHQGKLELALKLVDAAKRAGADAIKFQAFDPDELVNEKAPTATYQKRAARRRNQLEMLRKLALSADDFRVLERYARKRGIDFLLTPFDEKNLAFVLSLRPKAIKWSSGELTNLPLLAKAAASGKPLFVSTGMAGMDEVDAAVRTVRRAGNDRLVLLHCVSAYPAAVESLNLRVIGLLRDRFRVPVGFSDHTVGLWAAPVARALGAVVIEKHLTLSRKLVGPDHPMSLESSHFKKFVLGIRLAEKGLGKAQKGVTLAEREIQAVARRSVIAARTIPAGARITAADVTLKRPGTGIHPREIKKVIGCVANRKIGAGEVLKWKLVTKRGRDKP